MKLALIGIGQLLRGDDAVGFLAVQHWQKQHPAICMQHEIITECIELPGLNLLDLLDRADAAILVDAVRSLSPAGTIHILDQDQLECFDQGSRSAHGWGLAESLALARKLGLPDCRKPIRLIGIEVAQVDLGEELSLEIQRAIPAVCDAIDLEIQKFLQ